ncbi:hypothetical protein [Clostridium botulinum]|uniref:hypothetical protein n=1 Tax=Clostridium botulinum TaxID=1491 RepID=UPI00217E2DF2|nr:hypothetical protein [Clostridium botulinum]
MDRLLNKITSARWLIAIMLTITFVVLAITNKLTAEFITIYTMVMTWYFNKERQTKEG